MFWNGLPASGLDFRMKLTGKYLDDFDDACSRDWSGDVPSAGIDMTASGGNTEALPLMLAPSLPARCPRSWTAVACWLGLCERMWGSLCTMAGDFRLELGETPRPFARSVGEVEKFELAAALMAEIEAAPILSAFAAIDL
eukprot:939727-Rhodomonas_salina.4